MKAYCINLDRRPDRLDYMIREFGSHGVPFERISAVDAQDPAVAALAAACPPTAAGPRMSAGAYGCFQSHREFWRRLVASGDAHGMIFEDDLVLAPGIAQYLADGWVPADADIVRLETYETRAHLAAGKGIAAGSRRLFRLHSCILGTGCYVISNAAARRLLQQTEVFRDPIDEFLFNEKRPDFPHLALYQMVPGPVIQGDRVARVAQEGWSATSITGRFAGAGAGGPRPETPFDRLRRRLTEELRGRLHGTRYIRVPHG
ncbi:MAG: glycosyltransferase family 25 protein [Erythrobacter sp.]|nr:glycosyltransferase family 25 protein [Erythrobacter sp.]